jgi:tetratricopeptide (TPR) repeat protein
MMTLDDHPELEHTHALADGELTGDERERAQDHLATCERCQAELADVMQLKALPMPRPANVISLAWYRKRSTRVAGVLVVAAAAATVLYLGGRHPAMTAQEAPVKVALADTRAVEARLSWQGAADYRAYSVPRGQSLAKEPISLAAMADLEKRGDLHGVAALAILGGDLEQAKKYLALAGESADVLADRAALELSLGAPDKALAFADGALAKSPDASVATWNRALALRDLGLRHDAAEAFRAVAKHGESGWAGEATKRADELEHSFEDEIALTKRVSDAAISLAQTQSGLAVDDARRLPGLSRVELYDALRCAPNAAAVAKLMPIAEAIDSASGDHGTVDAVKAAKPDPRAAAAYLSILTDPKPDRAKVLATLRAAHASDALAVALVKLGDGGNVLSADLPEFTKLSKASTDPWIQLLGIEQRGTAAFAKGDLPGSEAALLPGEAMCQSGAPGYRCLRIEIVLGRTYFFWQRFPEASAALAKAWSRARALSQVQQMTAILAWLVDLATAADDTIGGGLPLVRAYTTELAARADDDLACDAAKWGHERIAAVLQVQLRFDEAKRELSNDDCKTVIRDDSAIAAGLLVRAEILHVVGTPQEVSGLRAVIDAQRNSMTSPGPRALLDHAAGRLVMDTDPGESEKLMHRAISGAREAPIDVDAQRAVGMSYAALAEIAAKHHDGDATLAVLGEEMGVTPRQTCVLGLIGDDRDSFAIVRDSKAITKVTISHRTSPAVVASEVVPAELVQELRTCDDVDVIARPPYDGLSRILPDDLAWRYVAGRPRPLGPLGKTSLTVADVQPPASVGLPKLASWTRTEGTVLAGPAATPDAVLAAIGEARDVTIHAHGLANEGDASYLALSEAADGRYSLTASDVARARFPTAPLVILAACETARTAPQFAQRWSLPAAFVKAGARGVVASTTAIPDRDAAKFFDALRTRAGAGESIAKVLRDLRKQWLNDSRADWVRDIVVFE